MPETEDLKKKIQDLPEKPGIYKFIDAIGTLIYVGKAKSIRKRVSSYFNKLHALDNKTRRLVSQIVDIEYTIVDSEFDAFLLENNLIKTFKPKFNILLRDDKTYPYLLITDERFPRLYATRSLDRSLGKYYGPYTSVKAMNAVMDLVKKIYALRTCNLVLSEKNINSGKYKICLEYHIGNCKGPCEGLISEEEYIHNIDQIHQILKGRISPVKQHFNEEMQKAASTLEFEKAQKYKEKLELLEKFQSSTIIVNPKITDLDVISIASDEATAVVNYLSIMNGIICKTKTIEIKKKLNESDEELLLLCLVDIRQELESESKEVITNIQIQEAHISELEITTPKIGDKKKLVEMSWKNAMYSLRKINAQKEEKVSSEMRIMQKLQQDLQLKSLPDHIECFDNSNIQGTNPVAAMVCFKNGKPAKKDYRHYNIKTVEGPDDFASMYEVVTRRYKRLLAEDQDLPKLIIIDGGKGQLNAAVMALTDLQIYGRIPIIGIAKRLEEIFYPGDQHPLYLDKKSESLKLIQFLRNEAHRFAISFHRDQRSRKTFSSELTRIQGIGEKTYEQLIKKFRTISGIKEASMEELKEVVGEKRAKLIKERLSELKN